MTNKVHNAAIQIFGSEITQDTTFDDMKFFQLSNRNLSGKKRKQLPSMGFQNMQFEQKQFKLNKDDQVTNIVGFYRNKRKERRDSRCTIRTHLGREVDLSIQDLKKLPNYNQLMIKYEAFVKMQQQNQAPTQGTETLNLDTQPQPQATQITNQFPQSLSSKINESIRKSQQPQRQSIPKPRDSLKIFQDNTPQNYEKIRKQIQDVTQNLKQKDQFQRYNSQNYLIRIPNQDPNKQNKSQNKTQNQAQVLPQDQQKIQSARNDNQKDYFFEKLKQQNNAIFQQQKKPQQDLYAKKDRQNIHNFNQKQDQQNTQASAQKNTQQVPKGFNFLKKQHEKIMEMERKRTQQTQDTNINTPETSQVEFQKQIPKQNTELKTSGGLVQQTFDLQQQSINQNKQKQQNQKQQEKTPKNNDQTKPNKSIGLKDTEKQQNENQQVLQRDSGDYFKQLQMFQKYLTDVGDSHSRPKQSQIEVQKNLEDHKHAEVQKSPQSNKALEAVEQPNKQQEVQQTLNELQLNKQGPNELQKESEILNSNKIQSLQNITEQEQKEQTLKPQKIQKSEEVMFQPDQTMNKHKQIYKELSKISNDHIKVSEKNRQATQGLITKNQDQQGQQKLQQLVQDQQQEQKKRQKDQQFELQQQQKQKQNSMEFSKSPQKQVSSHKMQLRGDKNKNVPELANRSGSKQVQSPDIQKSPSHNKLYGKMLLRNQKVITQYQTQDNNNLQNVDNVNKKRESMLGQKRPVEIIQFPQRKKYKIQLRNQPNSNHPEQQQNGVNFQGITDLENAKENQSDKNKQTEDQSSPQRQGQNRDQEVDYQQEQQNHHQQNASIQKQSKVIQQQVSNISQDQLKQGILEKQQAQQENNTQEQQSYTSNQQLNQQDLFKNNLQKNQNTQQQDHGKEPYNQVTFKQQTQQQSRVEQLYDLLQKQHQSLENAQKSGKFPIGSEFSKSYDTNNHNNQDQNANQLLTVHLQKKKQQLDLEKPNQQQQGHDTTQTNLTQFTGKQQENVLNLQQQNVEQHQNQQNQGNNIRTERQQKQGGQNGESEDVFISAAPIQNQKHQDKSMDDVQAQKEIQKGLEKRLANLFQKVLKINKFCEPVLNYNVVNPPNLWSQDSSDQNQDQHRDKNNEQNKRQENYSQSRQQQINDYRTGDIHFQSYYGKSGDYDLYNYGVLKRLEKQEQQNQMQHQQGHVTFDQRVPQQHQNNRQHTSSAGQTHLQQTNPQVINVSQVQHQQLVQNQGIKSTNDHLLNIRQQEEAQKGPRSQYGLNIVYQDVQQYDEGVQQGMDAIQGLAKNHNSQNQAVPDTQNLFNENTQQYQQRMEEQNNYQKLGEKYQILLDQEMPDFDPTNFFTQESQRQQVSKQQSQKDQSQHSSQEQQQQENQQQQDKQQDVSAQQQNLSQANQWHNRDNQGNVINQIQQISQSMNSQNQQELNHQGNRGIEYQLNQPENIYSKQQQNILKGKNNDVHQRIPEMQQNSQRQNQNQNQNQIHNKKQNQQQREFQQSDGSEVYYDQEAQSTEKISYSDAHSQGQAQELSQEDQITQKQRKTIQNIIDSVGPEHQDKIREIIDKSPIVIEYLSGDRWKSAQVKAFSTKNRQNIQIEISWPDEELNILMDYQSIINIPHLAPKIGQALVELYQINDESRIIQD